MSAALSKLEEADSTLRQALHPHGMELAWRDDLPGDVPEQLAEVQRLMREAEQALRDALGDR